MIRESINNKRQAPHVLVENKCSFAGEASELSIYDTFEQASSIHLMSDQLMFCGMVSGKKIMHANQGDFETDFLPHESFVMAPDSPVNIDFPIASIAQPTTCIAIEISSDRITQVCDGLNAQAPLLAYQQEWQYTRAYASQ